MSIPLLLTTDAMAVATMLVHALKASEQQSGEYANFTLSSLILGKLTSFAMQNDDGAIEDGELKESGRYDLCNGLFLGIQRNSAVTKVLWCKWASFEYDAQYFSIAKLRLVLHKQMLQFLFEYIDRAVLWPIGIDTLLKFYAALTSYSYETHLAFFLTETDVQVSKVYEGLGNKFAKAMCNGPLFRQAFYILNMIILTHTCIYADVVFGVGALNSMRSWVETCFPREGVNTLWLRTYVDSHMGVHDFLDDLDDFENHFKLDFDFVYHLAQPAQDLLEFSGAPAVNLDVVLDSFYRYSNGQPGEFFTPLTKKSKVDESLIETLYESSDTSSSRPSSPIESSRRCLLLEFDEAL